MAFLLDAGSNPYYFAVVVKYMDGEGDLCALDLHQEQGTASESWMSMLQLWGAEWKLNSGSELKAPCSLRLTSPSGKTLVASNVIPAGWQPGTTYRSVVNYTP